MPWTMVSKECETYHEINSEAIHSPVSVYLAKFPSFVKVVSVRYQPFHRPPSQFNRAQREDPQHKVVDCTPRACPIGAKIIELPEILGGMRGARVITRRGSVRRVTDEPANAAWLLVRVVAP